MGFPVSHSCRAGTHPKCLESQTGALSRRRGGGDIGGLGGAGRSSTATSHSPDCPVPSLAEGIGAGTNFQALRMRKPRGVPGPHAGDARESVAEASFGSGGAGWRGDEGTPEKAPKASLTSHWPS